MIIEDRREYSDRLEMINALSYGIVLNSEGKTIQDLKWNDDGKQIGYRLEIKETDDAKR